MTETETSVLAVSPWRAVAAARTQIIGTGIERSRFDGETPWPTVKPKGVSAVVIGIIGDEARRAYSVEGAKNEMPWAKIVEVGANGK